MKNLTKLLLITFLILKINLNAQENCEQILKYGLYDTNETRIEQSKSVWYVYKFVKDNYQSYSQAKSMDASAVIPIDDILVGLSFGTNESGFQELKSHIDRFMSFSQDEKFKLESLTKKINTNIVNAWSECLSKDGTHFYVIYTDNPKVFKLCGYINYRGGSIPYITTGGFDKKVIVKNDGPFFNKNGKLLSKNRIPFARTYQTFERENADPINLTINLSQGDSYTISIPSINLTNQSSQTVEYLQEIPLDINWNNNLEIPKNKTCRLAFVGELKFFDPIAPPGQYPRRPAINDEQLNLSFPANILQYRILDLDDKGNIVHENPLENWDGNQILLTSVNHKRKIQTCVRTFWLEKVTGEVTIKMETHAPDYFMKNCTHNAGTRNLSSKLLVDN